MKFGRYLYKTSLSLSFNVLRKHLRSVLGDNCNKLSTSQNRSYLFQMTHIATTKVIHNVVCVLFSIYLVKGQWMKRPCILKCLLFLVLLVWITHLNQILKHADQLIWVANKYYCLLFETSSKSSCESHFCHQHQSKIGKLRLHFGKRRDLVQRQRSFFFFPILFHFGLSVWMKCVV